MENLYLVSQGDVTEIYEPVEFDGADSVLVIATTASAALQAASQYDAGLLTYDNCPWSGETILAIEAKDKNGDWL